jgi:hypothetical protein
MAVRELREGYEKAMQTVAVLKKETTDDADRLDAFTDFLILESARAKRKCERLERKCRLQAFEPAGLKDLKTLCEQKERLAKDLLCYSLGHLRRRKPIAQRT